MKGLSISRRKMLTALGMSVGSTALAGPQRIAPASTENEDFRYCLNTSTLRGQSLGIAKEIEIAGKAGYTGIEVWINELDDYRRKGGTLNDLRARIEDAGLVVENAIGFAPWIVDDPSLRSQALEQLKREMDMLAQLGCTRLAAPPAGATQEPLLDLMKVAERYRAILDLGEAMKVIPQLEVWGFSKNLHRLGQVMFVAAESRHAQACILPDVYHLYKGGSDFEGLSLLSGSAIEIFHVNDYPAQPSREAIDDSYRVYPGDGTAPMTQILQYLRATGSGKVLSLELFNPSYWQQDALTVAKTGLAKMQECVAKALA